MSVRVILDIPDEIAAQLSSRGQELSRAALEALALESYRLGRLTQVQVGRLSDYHASKRKTSWQNTWICTITSRTNFGGKPKPCPASPTTHRVSSKSDCTHDRHFQYLATTLFDSHKAGRFSFSYFQSRLDSARSPRRIDAQF